MELIMSLEDKISELNATVTQLSKLLSAAVTVLQSAPPAAAPLTITTQPAPILTPNFAPTAMNPPANSLPGFLQPPMPFPTLEQRAAPAATYDEVKAALVQLSSTPGRTMQTITDLLGRFGVKSAQNLPPDMYGQMVAQAKALIADPKAQP
jgi:hypothetical protein